MEKDIDTILFMWYTRFVNQIERCVDMGFEILTDSSCNLTDEQIKKYHLNIISLTYHIGDEAFHSYQKDVDTNLKSVYTRLRNKDHITTSLISYEDAYNAMDEILARGEDVLYLGFSSGISGSFQNACNVAADLREKYPERKLYCVDTLCASMGEGLLVHYVVQLKNTGADIETCRDWAEQNKLKVCHSFTVDDLFFLKRGGRIGATTAIFGSLLGIKPVMKVDNEGKLCVIAKARGRKASLDALVQSMKEKAVDPQKQTVFISHGDCLADAEYVRDQVMKLFGVKEVVINYVDAVIGAHSGPGTLALFFMGTER